MSKYKKIAFLFPGQGAQYVGMGKDFFQNFAPARLTFEEADDFLGRSLSKIVFEGPDQKLTETQNSQTGIYVTSIAILRTLQSLYSSLKPNICAGLSLGEYTALHASGKIDFIQGLSLVNYRSQYMNEACEKTKGTMAVILGLEGPEVEAIVRNLNLPHDLWVANFNCPGQVVISGTQKGIEIGSVAAKEKGAKRVLPLQVHGAFHSGLMRSAEEKLARHVMEAPLQASPIELVMNVLAQPVSDLDQIRTSLIKQVTSPVRWEEIVRYMASSNVELYLEIGCGKTLSGFNKRIGVPSPTVGIEKIEDLTTLEQILA